MAKKETSSTQGCKDHRTSRRRITLIVNIKIGKDQMLLSFPIICFASSWEISC